MTSLITPGDAEYDVARSCWNLTFDQRPAAAVRATSVEDVVAAVRHARAQGLSVAVQATGHGMTVAADDTTLLIDLSALDHVAIDPRRAVATVGGGARWGAVLAAAQEHGLAPLLGSAPHVGAVGYTLGGGLGWLARRHGLAVDRVTRMRVVLADGRVVEAAPGENHDLYWALLGGGAGSLGVVVEMDTGLVPVAEVYAGNLFYPVDAAKEVFDFYLDWTETVGEDFTSAFNVTAFPPLEVVPEPLRGRQFAIVRGCHCGDPREGEALVDLWRRWRAPAVDMFAPIPFSAVATISNDPVDPVPATTTGRWLREADQTTFAALADAVLGDGSPLLFAELRHAGGAVARPNEAVSHAGRAGRFSLEAVALTPSAQEHADARARFATLTGATAAQEAEHPAYLNFLEAEERVALARDAFDAATCERLAAVKGAVDPDDVFSRGIPL